MANTEQFTFQLLEAMNIISSASAQQVSFDRTIICTITDASKAKEGVYQVSDGSVKFEAHAEETNYREKDQVRVQIPNGDITQDKYIIGKAIQKDLNQPINYVSPSERIVGLTDKLITSSNKIELIATSDKTRTAISMGIDVEKLKINLSIIDSIVVGFKAQTFFLQEFMQRGNYGVIIQLSDGEKTKEFEFDNEYFLGNTYAFAIPTTQEALFDVKDENFVIKSIRLDFYQDGNFQYINPQTGVLEDYTSENEKGLANIIFSDFFITFGNSLSTYEDNTVKIFADTTTYDVSKKDQNIKLNLVWYNKTENNEYLGFSDGKVPELKDTNIVNSYSEIKYDNEYADHQKLNQTYQSQLAKDKENRDTPLDELGLRLYRACLDEQKEYDNIVSNATNLDALLDKIIDRIENETDKKVFSSAKGAISGQINSLENNQKILLNGGGTTEVEGVSSEGILSILKRIYNKYEQINTDELQEIVIEDAKEAFNYIFSEIDTIVTQLNTLLETKMSSAEGINQFNLYSSDLTKYKTLFEESKNKIQNYFFIDNNNETKDFFELIMEYNSTDTYNYIPYKISYEDLINNDYANKYCIYWYRKNSQETNFDKYSGAGWTRLEELDNKGLPVGQSYDKETLYYSKTPVNLDDPAVQAQIPFSSLNSKAEKESFKAVVIFNHQYYTSNIIEVENINQVIEDASLELVNGDLSQDFYQFYNEDYELINDIEAYRHRKLKPKVNWYDKVNDFSWEDVTVTWLTPVVNSMLVFDFDTLEAAGWKIGEVPDPEKGEIYRSVSAVLPLVPPQSESAQAETNEDSVSTPELIYQIRDFYSPYSKNNTIKCIINYPDGNSYDAEKSIGFGALGTNGSDYTIQIAPAAGQTAILMNINTDGKPHQPLLLDINLINQKGEILKIDPTVTTLRLKTITTNGDEWAERAEEIDGVICYHSELFQIEKVFISENSITGVQLKYNDSDVNNMENLNEKYVLFSIETSIFEYTETIYDSSVSNTVTVTTGTTIRQIKIGREYPVPLSIVAEPFYLYEGLKTITYNYQGGQPSYYKNPCNLRTQNNQLIGDITWGIELLTSLTGEAFRNISWKLEMRKDNSIIVPDMYIKENKPSYFLIYAKNKNGTIIWSQPILVKQNLFASALLNDWTGKTEVGEHTILSNMVGAGIKNANNEFSGVLMGDVQEAGYDTNLHGLYGFQNNNLNFALTIDGKLRLGNSTSGTQLIFDGSSSGGTIMSNNYLLELNNGVESPTVGMKIDLAEGHIDAYNFKLTSKNILIDSNADSGYYFQIKGPKNSSDSTLVDIFSVSKTDNDSYGAGIVNLAGWTVDNNSIRFGGLGQENSMWLCSSGTSSSANIGNSGLIKNWNIACGPNFGVNKNGNVYLSGKITATSGKIGNWEITELDSSGKYGGYLRSVYNNNEIIISAPGTRTSTTTDSGESTLNQVITIGEVGAWTSGIGALPFAITADGSMYATKGEIGGWTIASNSLTSPKGKFFQYSGGNGNKLEKEEFVFKYDGENNRMFLGPTDFAGDIAFKGAKLNATGSEAEFETIRFVYNQGTTLLGLEEAIIFSFSTEAIEQGQPKGLTWQKKDNNNVTSTIARIYADNTGIHFVLPDEENQHIYVNDSIVHY